MARVWFIAFLSASTDTAWQLDLCDIVGIVQSAPEKESLARLFIEQTAEATPLLCVHYPRLFEPLSDAGEPDGHNAPTHGRRFVTGNRVNGHGPLQVFWITFAVGL